jgi:hypothetical protein
MEARKPRRKTKKHTVRRKRTMHECSAKPTHRRKFHRKKKGLSEIMNSAEAANQAKTIASVVIGALIGQFVHDMLPKQSALTKVGITAVGGFLAGTLLKMPALGAGIAAPSVVNLVYKIPTLKEKGFSEPAQYLSEDELKSLPAVLSEMNLLSEMNPLSENAMQYASGINNW